MALEIRRPLLVPYARYRWDKIREQHQVVYPEGVLVLNDTSEAILKLCDGRRLDEVVAELSKVYKAEEADIEGDVVEFLGSLSERGLLCEGNESS